ncbi:MAG: tetratricopeptide repeat protein [Magnetococcales bacterium]|nr:tetratricopeptide repeat protein [Magnetococcales bacterium]
MSQAPTAVANLFETGVQWHHQGRLEDAVRCYQQVLQRQPDHAEALNNYGMILQDQNLLQQSEAMFRRALAIRPRFVECMNNLASVLKQQGRHAAALELLLQAVEIQPDYLEALFNGGCLLMSTGHWQQACNLLAQARQIKPDHGMILLALGIANQQQGHWDLAMECLREGVRLYPDDPQMLQSLGQATLNAGRLEEAIAYFDRAIQRHPAFPEAWNGLGIAWDGRGDGSRAWECFRQALRFRPDSPEILNNCGNILQKQFRPEEARSYYNEALRLQPDYVDAWCNLGGCLHQLGELQEALAALAKALTLKPDLPSAHYNESLIRLLLGEFSKGWEKLEWRWRSRDVAPHPHGQPLWDGSPAPDQTLLVHCEQGMGDSIQFIRYVPLIKPLVRQLVLLCPAALESLFGDLQGVDLLTSAPQRLPRCDLQVPLMSLPRLFRTDIRTIPRTVPYLHSDPHLAARFNHRLGPAGRLKVGFAWKGNPRQKNDGNRSMDLSTLVPILEMAEITLISLQKDCTPDEREILARYPGCLDLSDELADFSVTAALISQLDLVVSVDTSVIHLVGSLGRPGWVMLAAVPDWRWLLECEDSPWYPSLRLLRQKQAKQWAPVVNQVLGGLGAMLTHGKSRSNVVNKCYKNTRD